MSSARTRRSSSTCPSGPGCGSPSPSSSSDSWPSARSRSGVSRCSSSTGSSCTGSRRTGSASAEPRSRHGRRRSFSSLGVRGDERLRRAPAGRGTRRRGACPRARDAAPRLRPAVRGRGHASPAGRSGLSGSTPSRPARAQGPPRICGPARAAPARPARRPGGDRAGRLLAGRGAPRPGVRIPAPGDHLHRHEHLGTRPRGGRGARRATRPHHRHGALPPGERDAGRRAAGLRPGPRRGRAPGAPARGRKLPVAGGQRRRRSGDAAARRRAADGPRRLRRHPRRALRDLGLAVGVEPGESPSPATSTRRTTSPGRTSPSPRSPRATSSPWWVSAATARACAPTTAAGRAPARSSSRSAPRWQLGKEVAKLPSRGRKEPAVGGDAHDRLGHAEGDDLGVGDAPASIGPRLWQEIVGCAINDRAESVEVGVHRGLQADGDLGTVGFGLSALLSLDRADLVESVI